MSRTNFCSTLLALTSALVLAAVPGRLAAQSDGMYVRYNPSTGIRAFVTPEAPATGTGMLENPAPRVVLMARCRGENCKPTEFWLEIVRTAGDMTMQGAYAPLSIMAGTVAMRWDQPEYDAEQAGLGMTRERVRVPLTVEQVRALAEAREVFGRVGLVRDFSVKPEGLRIFSMMAATLSVQ